MNFVSFPNQVTMLKRNLCVMPHSLTTSYKRLLYLLLIIFCSLLQIARRLLGKILIDLRNTREEATSVVELKSNQDQTSMFLKLKKEEVETPGQLNKNEDRRSSSISEKSLDQDDDDDKETKYRLDPKLLSYLTCLQHYFLYRVL